jgi:hypothetical protein
MAFAPAIRKFTFTTHVTSSVGWMGAVLVFLALAAIGLSSQDERAVRGAYLSLSDDRQDILPVAAGASDNPGTIQVSQDVLSSSGERVGSQAVDRRKDRIGGQLDEEYVAQQWQELDAGDFARAGT